jgi:hypothetical protein
VYYRRVEGLVRRIWLLALFMTLLLGGCDREAFTTGLENAEGGVMRTAFDPAAAAFVLAPATATVRGRFYQTLESGTIPGKFGTVKLIPDTPYAREHLGLLFGGACSYGSAVTIANVDPRYNAHMRVARAGPDGEFEVFGVPDGAYLIYAYRTSERVYFANRASVTVAGQQDVTVDVGCR